MELRPERDVHPARDVYACPEQGGNRKVKTIGQAINSRAAAGLLVPVLAGVTGTARAAAGGAGHGDPFAGILLELALLILAAMVGRWAAGRLGQPSVLGELLIGVLIGNVLYAAGGPLAILIMHADLAGNIVRGVWDSGLSVAEVARGFMTPGQLQAGSAGAAVLAVLTGEGAPRYLLMSYGLWVFSNLGVILLLFMVGLESRVEEMLQVGYRALAVAVVGIAIPFALGYGASRLFLPAREPAVDLFVGATLAATSVGITARVFKDLGRTRTREARLILGAAVIDDILGLIILAVVTGIVTRGALEWGEVARITLVSGLFFGLLVGLGGRFMPMLTGFAARIERQHLTLLFPLFVAFMVAWAANRIGLATIVGAFAAGLIVNEEHFAAHRGADPVPIRILAPLEALFAPVFFILMGMQVNLAAFLDPDTLGLAAALVVVATLGKAIAGMVAGPGVDRLSVGIGMVPRGEVGLIFVSIGKGLGVVSGQVFSAVVIMVIVTTLITPLGLRWSLGRRKRES
ncbi:sodium/proton antiporter NhaS3 (CPA2 family) [Thioalbus denitrificans]|uniref:Sodium/proton antiporter NhaS3 (CPA2 family) n=1 Tax=Thioalbus denitrificans TaxID=547122 RepID=A0A369CCI0_9GAMM|nr:sodium/proton antiporter NhaS3 (CPA2 family) [Thioalbus denitrificans]